MTDPKNTSREDERSGTDRRRSGLPGWRYLLFGGRRRVARRNSDGRRIVLLDRYSPKLFAAMMGILALSLLDAALTLFLVSHGSSEINPIMNYFLTQGPMVFMIAKYALTSIAVIIFVLLANSASPQPAWPIRRLYRLALLAFGGVVAWELVLVCILAARA